jgi:hypothetical protein
MNASPTHTTTGAGATAAQNLLEDLAAFVSDFGNDMSVPQEKRLAMIRETIAHDVAGLLANKPCFVPRCDGWRNAGK